MITVKNLNVRNAADHRMILSKRYRKLLISYAVRIFMLFCNRRFEMLRFIVILVEMSDLGHIFPKVTFLKIRSVSSFECD